MPRIKIKELSRYEPGKSPLRLLLHPGTDPELWLFCWRTGQPRPPQRLRAVCCAGGQPDCHDYEVRRPCAHWRIAAGHQPGRRPATDNCGTDLGLCPLYRRNTSVVSCHGEYCFAIRWRTARQPDLGYPAGRGNGYLPSLATDYAKRLL